MKQINSDVKTIRERVVEDELVRRVRALGGVCEKVAIIGKRGWPDRFVALPNFVALVETKRPRGGRLAVHQEKWRDVLTALGVRVVVVKNLAQIDQLVQKASRKTKGPRRG